MTSGMSPERLRRLEELYHAAEELEVGQREAFLEAKCGTDAELRREVEALLEHSAEGILDQSPWATLAHEGLAEGSQLGPYQILGQIGAGGMGEVYRAKDTRLDRIVAVKVLPAHLSAHPEARDRLEREARAVSGLNHPHICTLYDVGNQDGIYYLVMEYLNGETLAARLDKGALPLERALTLATQVADALAAAHREGIVHRDLKPANVMLTKSGAKLLDFGLAKIAPAPAAAGETATVALTSPGTILGTFQYMSPEQLEAKETDSRTDIFAFGTLLYEMLTGRKAFEAPSQASMIAAIMSSDPPAVSSLQPLTPPALDSVVRTCLAKDPDRRWQSAQDVGQQLRAIAEAGPPKTPQATIPAVSSRQWLWLAITAAALLAAGLVWLRHSRAGAPAGTFQNIVMSQLTSTGKARHAAISSDGKYVVYVEEDAGKQSLWIRQVAVQSSVQILPPDEIFYSGLAFLSDGNFVFYTAARPGARGALYKLPMLGGEPRKILEPATGAAFSPDGERIAYRRGGDIMTANADGSGVRTIASVKFPRILLSLPAWSPDGKAVAWGIQSRTPIYEAGISIFDSATGAEKLFRSQHWFQISNLAWLPDSSGLLATANIDDSFHSGQLWRISYPDGASRPITRDLNRYSGLSITADASKIATVATNLVSNVWVMQAGAPAAARQITSGTGTHDGRNGVSFTDDGRLIYTADANGGQGLWLIGPSGGQPKLLSTDQHIYDFPVVCPVGHQILFVSNRSGAPNVWRADSDGSNLKQLTEGNGFNPDCSSDGRQIVYTGALGQIMKIPIDGGAPSEISGQQVNDPVISPDGRWVAGLGSDAATRKPQVVIVPFAAGPPSRTLRLPGNTPWIRWTPDGNALTYTETHEGVSNLWNLPIDGGPAKPLTSFTSGKIFNYAWSRDGRQLALARGSENSDVVLIKNAP